MKTYDFPLKNVTMVSSVLIFMFVPLKSSNDHI